MFPAVSLSDAGTFDGANIIGRLPATPLLKPRAAVKKNDIASPDITGLSLGAQHINSNGMRSVRRLDMRVNWRRDQAYGMAANIFPNISDVLKVNMSRTGIHDLSLQDLISDSSPG